MIVEGITAESPATQFPTTALSTHFEIASALFARTEFDVTGDVSADLFPHQG
jgi:hypothetical protein